MKRVLFALGGAVLLLAAVLLIRTWRDASASQPGYAFDTASAPSITRVRFAYQQDSVTLVRREGRWADAGDGFPVDTLKLAAVLAQVVRVQDRERVSLSSDSARLVEFGLDPVSAKRVEWTSGDKTFNLLLGKTSGADYNSTYWKHPGEAGVFRTPGSFTYDIPVRSLDWRDRTLIPAVDPAEVRVLEVEWVDDKAVGGKPVDPKAAGARVRYRIERTGDTTFRMTEPLEAAVPAASARPLFDPLAGFSADAFVDPADPFLSEVGLDSAAVVLRVHLRNGSVHVISAGPAQDDGHYARHPAAQGAVVRLYASRFRPYRKQPHTLLAPPPAGVEEIAVP